MWRHRDLRIAVAGRSVSYLGDDLAVVALVLFAYDAGWGTPGVAALLAAAALPWAVGAPYAGRYADRTDSRRVTVGTSVVQAVLAAATVAVVAVLPIGSPATVAAVLLLVAAINLVQAAAAAGWQALTPHLVPADEVPRAVSAGQTGAFLATLAAPGLAGVLVAAGGAPVALAANAVTFGLLAVAARTVQVVRRPEPGVGADSAWAGLAVIRADRLFSTLLGGLLVVLLVVQVVVVVDVFLVRGVFGAGPSVYGLVSLALAGGGLAGAVLAGRARGDRNQAWGIVGSLAVISVLTVGTGIAPNLVLVTVALAGVGLGFGALNVFVGSFTVARTADAVRGRVFAAVAGSTQLATLVGLGLAAWLGGLLGPRPAFVTAGLIGTAACAGLVVVVLGTIRTAPATSDIGSG